MTIKDIAKLSGVGVSTVSRVLNDRPDVSEESRRRVLSIIAEYNYLPNNSARSLVRTKSDAIGLVVRGVQNPLRRGRLRSRTACRRSLRTDGGMARARPLSQPARPHRAADGRHGLAALVDQREARITTSPASTRPSATRTT